MVENGNSLDIGQTITVNPTGNSTLFCLTLSEECGSRSYGMPHCDSDPIIPQINPDFPVQCLPGEFIFYNNSNKQRKFSPQNSFFQVET